MKEEHTLLIMDYLEGHWNDQKEAKLQQLLASGEISQEELSDWQMLYEESPQLPTPAPSSQLRENFYSMLGSWEQAQTPSWWQRLLQSFNTSIRVSQLVTAILLLLVGVAVGFWLSPVQRYESQIGQLSSEVQQMREAMVLTLLEQPSAMQRLKAVSISTDLSSSTEKIHHALLRTLNEDAQVNVRLAALEALLPYAHNSLVRQGLVQSIAQQNDPLIQIALAQAMVQLQEKQAVAPLKDLLEKESLNQDVQQTIEQSLEILI
ncbi:HEAT repeat domain-containing protein [Tunicatimonas pelagia]|uniref:HEAT repeat domain-containing protein n=1 Tax=Tunicatimonas pelagia TaxID=931531 RepID=UPI002666FFFC|nr:HEAT repeat domain-containing protein [Tunicatimonas pelagia]WKN40925.1 HEAT repeat domain-containing protein [Tunicatimonas pelagia]